MIQHPSSKLERIRHYVSVALLFVVFCLGAGEGPITYFVVEATALVLLLLALMPAGSAWPPGSRPFMALIAAVCLLMIVQVIPLPYPIWRALPGRALATQILEAAALAPNPRPLSLDPGATLAGLLYLIPGIAMFFATCRASSRDQLALCACVVLAALVSSAFSVAQNSGVHAAYLYPTSHEGYGVGLFRNRNHEAVFLAIGIALLPVVHRFLKIGRIDAGPRLAITLAGMGVLGLTVFTTTSRAGLLLMPIAILSALTQILPFRHMSAWRSRHPVMVVLTIVIGSAVAIALLSGSDVTRAVVQRLGGSFQDIRLVYWQDTLFAIQTYWPVGSGFGTFVPIYASVEALESVATTYVNHAHNDYLEYGLEGGLPAIVLLVAYFILLALTVFRRRPADDGTYRRCAAVGILLLLLHSIVDYPLRTYVLLTIFGLLNGMLFTSARPRSRRDTAERLR